MDFTPDTGCTDIYSDRNISNTVVAVTRGDCNFAVKAAFILKNGGIGVLNVSPDNKTQVTFEPLPSTQQQQQQKTLYSRVMVPKVWCISMFKVTAISRMS